MKKRLITVIIMTVLASPTLYANNKASCAQDTDQMRMEISTWGSITTKNRKQINRVSYPVAKGDTCTADGYNFGFYICNLSWEVGNWGNTLDCS
jgi:hypothetical protein